MIRKTTPHTISVAAVVHGIMISISIIFPVSLITGAPGFMPPVVRVTLTFDLVLSSAFIRTSSVAVVFRVARGQHLYPVTSDCYWDLAGG